MVRSFVVGCPRSGTTLLQAILGAHSQVYTLPESHFFRKSFKSRRSLLAPGIRTSHVLRTWLEKVGMEAYIDQVPKYAVSQRPVVDAFVRILDEVSAQDGRRVWVEKTPGHVFVIPDIQRMIPDARFIHIIRDGRAVVASLCDAKNRYPRVWGKRTLSDFVQLWNDAILESSRYVEQENHIAVSYTMLTKEPEAVLRSLCSFLSLQYEVSALEDYRIVASRVTLPGQGWIERAGEAISDRGLSKYETVLTQEDRSYIERHLIALPKNLQGAVSCGTR